MARLKRRGVYFAWYVTPFSKKRRCVRLYGTYRNMLNRTKGYIKDGTGQARWKGLEVGFKNFMEFRSWALLNGFRKGVVLDRREETRGYFPDNCQWITSVQNRLKAANIHKKSCKCFWCKGKRRA